MEKCRRIISIILCVAILFICHPGFFYAAQMYTYGDFTYTINGQEATVIDCDDSDGRITVPSRFDSFTVTAIGAFAFANKNFVSVVLPKTVTEIKNGAFMDCKALTSVTISEGLITMGDNAFYGCSVLDELELPDSLEFIGIDAFEQCGEDFTILGYSGSFAEEYAIEYGYGFESLGESEKKPVASGTCGDNAVWSLSELGVLTISGFGEMYAESSNNYWSEYTAQIKNIVVEDGITSIMNDAFMSCVNLETVLLPETIVKIGNYAFSSCTKLKGIDIRPGVEQIGTYAFYGCSSLGKITLPDTVKSVGYRAFERCSALKSAVLPKGLKNIEDYTFFWCESLRNVVLPDALKTIGMYAFSNCYALTDVKLTDRITTIKKNAFGRCSLSEIIFPASVSVIEEDAFSAIEPAPLFIGYDGSTAQSYALEYGFAFESLGEMPVTVIGEGDFGENLSWNVNTLGHLVISGTGASDDFYSSSPAPWSEYKINSMKVEEGITYIGKSMFNGLDSITEVSIPKTVREIGAAAFGGCSSLEAVAISDGVTDIGSSAFAGCIKLSEITIPSSVTYIAYEGYETRDAFSGCGDNFTVKGYENTAAELYAEIEGYKFESIGTAESCIVKSGTYNDTNKEAVISYSLTNDGIMSINADSAYTMGSDNNVPWYRWYAVRELVLGDNIRIISNYAFENQKYLEKVSFPETVTEIGTYAFGNRTLAFEVCGYDNTVAQAFAESKNLKYTSLGEATVEIILASGSVGSSCTWELNNFGVLTVKGTGRMNDYNRPWENYREKIREIVIEKGINSIGDGAFEYAYNATKITIPYTVVNIGSSSVYNGITVYGYEGTAAEEYARERSMSFVSLGMPPKGEIIIEDVCGENTYWSLTSDGVFTISGSGYVDYSDWYNQKNLIKKVIIEEGVTNINIWYAFEQCENLTEVVISDSVTGLNGNAFSNCPKLKSVKLSKAADIPYECFKSCYALEEIIIPSGVKSIDGLAFYDCSNLKAVTIPASVTNIISSAFENVSSELVITGYSETYVESYAEQNYITFNSLGIAPLEQEQLGTTGNLSWRLTTDGTMTISGSGSMPDYTSYARLPWHDYKKNINKLVIDEGVTTVGAYTFSQCNSISEISLPSTLKRIEAYAFWKSAMPEKLELPYGTEYIGYSAFYGSTGLKEVVIPETVLEIEYSFSGYERTLTISGLTGSRAEKYAKEGGFTFKSLGVMERKIIASGDCGDNIIYEFDNYGQLTIDGFGAMWDYEEDYTPWNREMIESLKICDGVEYIGDYSFSQAYNLINVQLPETLVQIGDYAFFGCHQIPLLVLPESLEAIDDYAFAEGGSGIVVPEGVVFIGENAFMYRAVYIVQGSYAEEYCKQQPESMGVRWFYKTASGKAGEDISWSVDAISGVLKFTGSGAMYDYINYEEYYSSTALWTQYTGAVKEIQISEGITYIGAGTMQRISNVETVVLPESLIAIGNYAFMDSQIKNITIPGKCMSIGEGAFTYCWKMETINIPSSVESIGENAFEYCDELTIFTPAGSYAWDYANLRNMPVIATKAEAKFETAFAYVDTYYNDIQMEIDGIELNADKIFCVTYDEEGKLLQTARYGELLSAENVASVRCFMWESMVSMKPLCKPIDAKIIVVENSSGSGSTGGETSVPEVGCEAALEV